MKNHLPIIAFGLLLSLLSACKETPDDYTTEFGYEYYPLQVGKFIEYQMDSTIYDPNGDTTVYHSTTFIREEILDTLSDNNGNTLYKIEQFERSADIGALDVRGDPRLHLTPHRTGTRRQLLHQVVATNCLRRS